MLELFLLISAFAQLILLGPPQLLLMLDAGLAHEGDGPTHKLGDGRVAHIGYSAVGLERVISHNYNILNHMLAIVIFHFADVFLVSPRC